MAVEREWVVQYRRLGAKKWRDSHVESFPTRPSETLIKDEFIETAEDLIYFKGNNDTPKLSGDFEVRVVRREFIEREIPIGRVKRFNNQDIIRDIIEKYPESFSN